MKVETYSANQNWGQLQLSDRVVLQLHCFFVFNYNYKYIFVTFNYKKSITMAKMSYSAITQKMTIHMTPGTQFTVPHRSALARMLGFDASMVSSPSAPPPPPPAEAPLPAALIQALADAHERTSTWTEYRSHAVGRQIPSTPFQPNFEDDLFVRSDMSLLTSSLNSGIILVARRYILSSSSISFLRYGLHVCIHYSKCCRTIALYRGTISCLSLYVIVLLIGHRS